MQLTRSFYILAAISSSALAYTLKARDAGMSVLTDQIPAACADKCAGPKNSLLLPSEQTLTACHQDTLTDFPPCIDCWLGAGPPAAAALDSNMLFAIQAGLDNLVRLCGIAGTPLTSVVIPTATGNGGNAAIPPATSAPASGSGAAATPAPSSSKPPASNGSTGASSPAATSSTHSGSTSIHSHVLSGSLVAFVGVVGAAML